MRQNPAASGYPWCAIALGSAMKSVPESLPMQGLRLGLRLLASACIAAASLAAGAQPSAMSDLMFQSESNAAKQLSRRGYMLSNQESAGGNRYWQYWWSAQRGECLRVAINHGQVTQLIGAHPGDCPQRGGGVPPPFGGSGGGWGGGSSGGSSPQSDLVDRPESVAARELQRRGYLLSNTVSASGGYWQYWWSAQRGECLRVAINHGQVTQLIGAHPGDCPQRGGGVPPPFGGSGGAWGGSSGGGSSPQSDLVDRPESVAARELQRRGYLLSNTVSADHGYWQYWWSGQRGQCLRVAVNQGRVTQILVTNPAECPRHDGGFRPPPVGPGAVPEPTDLLNQSVSTAERSMPQRGYVLIRTAGAQGAGYWQYWWHGAGQQCIRVAVNSGRITQVAPRSSPDCQR